MQTLHKQLPHMQRQAELQPDFTITGAVGLEALIENPGDEMNVVVF